jgi:molybdenum-dependent DNA-binding transcriptional regulator ModE
MAALMEMHQVRYFLVLCEEGSFTRAARRCGVAQPSLTNAIKRLERDLGAALFDRSRTGAALTPFGAALQCHFARIEQSAAAIKFTAEFHSRPLQPLQRKELAMSKDLLLSSIVLVLLICIGGFFGSSEFVVPSKSAAAVTSTIDPYAMHLAVDLSALPETRVQEPF